MEYVPLDSDRFGKRDPSMDMASDCEGCSMVSIRKNLGHVYTGIASPKLTMKRNVECPISLLQPLEIPAIYLAGRVHSRSLR